MVDSSKKGTPQTWHILSPGKPEPDGSISAEAGIGADSLWFSGHFPNEPILPGIALLAMVGETIRRRQAEAGKKSRIANIRKVRFRLPVRPGASLSLRLTSADKDDIAVYQFRIALPGEAGETVCTGIMDAVPV